MACRQQRSSARQRNVRCLQPHVTPGREATDHRSKEVDRKQRMIGTQTEHTEEAQYREVGKKVRAHSRGTGATPRAPSDACSLCAVTCPQTWLYNYYLGVTSYSGVKKTTVGGLMIVRVGHTCWVLEECLLDTTTVIVVPRGLSRRSLCLQKRALRSFLGG